ncbi:MAG TPA: ABC transporter ATP-binding protein [Gaiellaceae bacterium]|nr:ABC transporter ATP-binding protein [Gaiellaceae bacterium]
MSIAELAGVTKRFGELVALDDVSFGVRAGDVVALLGPNGAGKSTALGVLLGLRFPDSGTARLFGQDPRRIEPRREIGVTPQETAFPTTLRVRELVDLVRAHYARPLPAATVLSRFGLTELAGRQLGGLSGGERRRVGVALAFAGAPRLVVLDEPTAGLDVTARHAVWEAIRAHADDGGTILFTTHQLDEADTLAERAVLIERGSIVADGTIEEIKAAAGLTRVSFRAPEGLSIDDAKREGELLCILTSDAGAIVERLARTGVPLVDLEVRPLTLEEALAVRKATL